MTNWQSPTTDKLLDAILVLESRDEARRFLRDLLTPQEIGEFANRWQVAQMLCAGLPYSEIKKQTGMSSTTIARVSKFLKGKYGGYRSVLRRLKTSEVEYIKSINRDSTSEVKGFSRHNTSGVEYLENTNNNYSPEVNGKRKQTYALGNQLHHHHQALKLEDGS